MLEDVKDQVNKVVEWYKDRKFSNRDTAKKFVNDLMGDNKRSVTFAKKRFDKKFEQIEGRAPLNERMRMNRDRKDYNITFLLYGSHSGQGRIAFKDNQGESHSLLLISQPLQLTLKNVRDEDKLSETLVRKYVAIDKFDLWVKDLQRRLKLKKGDSEKITKKEFDELNTREAWREETGTTEEQRKRRKSKTTDRRFDLIHDTELFNKLLNRLVLKNKELVHNTLTLKTTLRPSK